ncbi:hypothetical protein ACHQM5_028098 [Ranunculus cassubicifolius]
MESLQSRVETWINDQRIKLSWPQLKWPPWKNNDREQRKLLKEEYERRKKQIQELCLAVKAESVSDLQDILSSMVLSECVYKKPATEIIRVVNKFKADFGGQVVSLERVQPSLDHVSHRYLLAEAGDTLYASFIGTKQYKDIFADANILQGAIFHEEIAEDIEEKEITDDQVEGQELAKPFQSKTNAEKHRLKPAAHRGFLARAKGIPALELYRLAQKKNQKLVLCGHSLGGAVAALATLAILRVIAASSLPKENNNVQVKCITFSQPPVGNAALRDYVHKKGWRHYFKTYCIPEDLVPRILSPAYFHHYNSQVPEMPIDEGVSATSAVKGERQRERSESVKLKENDREQLVLGLGPVHKSFWRLSKLVPLQAVQEQINRFRKEKIEPGGITSSNDAGVTSNGDEIDTAQHLEIQEGSDSISLKPVPNTHTKEVDKAKSNKVAEKSVVGNGESNGWRRVPYLPSYVPFGQLYLLGSSSVESLSAAEYSKLTSVKSVFVELRERLQSHSMRSYRSRFQKIYDLCMCSNPPFLGLEQLPQFPNLQQWLDLTVAGAVELGSIVEPPIIRTATSIIPLGWGGVSGGKNGEPFKVDITGYGLHLCNLVQAYVNGNWCSTTVESLPSVPAYTSNPQQQDMQKMRILVGAPVKNHSNHQIVTESFMPGFPPADMETLNTGRKYNIGSSHEIENQPEGLSSFSIFCTSDFTTVSKEVFVRSRKVQLVGLEGAGKTSLFNAILGQGKPTTISFEALHPEIDCQEGTTGGLCFLDSAGINLQELNMEVARFRDKLWTGIRDLSRKTDLVVLVHNLSHKVPQFHQSNPSQPALSLLLNEAKTLGVPWILAITNKFSVSADQQKPAVSSVIHAYQASTSMTEVINSCPYVIPDANITPYSWSEVDDIDSTAKIAPPNPRLSFNPINLVRMPFQKKTTVLPVDGVASLCQLIHRVLQSQEEASLEELARERLLLESSREEAMAGIARGDDRGKGNSITSATIGASIGAGLGLVLAVVMGAASALRKP